MEKVCVYAIILVILAIILVILTICPTPQKKKKESKNKKYLGLIHDPFPTIHDETCKLTRSSKFALSLSNKLQSVLVTHISCYPT